MRVLFVTANAYLPQARGGMQSSANELCIGLRERGHQVAVLAGIKPRSDERPRDAVVECDYVSEYRVWRAWCPWDALRFVVEREQPELIVVMSNQQVRTAMAATPTRIPIVVLLQNVQFDLLAGSLKELGNIPYLANSRFTAERYRTAFGINPRVVYPVIRADRYRTESTRENVTFINPIPFKGRDIALGIARLCPEIRFTFVESWRLFPENRDCLLNELRTLPNVTFLPPQNDMRSVYGRCRILLAPSVWDEGYGRVVTEAQISGIPVIASSRGGLPEAVGTGGIILDPQQPIEDWVEAVRKLWHDTRQHDELSAAATAHAQRPELGFSYQIDTWENIMRAAASASLPKRNAGKEVLLRDTPV